MKYEVIHPCLLACFPSRSTEAKLEDALAAGYQGALYLHAHFFGEKRVGSEFILRDGCPSFLIELVNVFFLFSFRGLPHGDVVLHFSCSPSLQGLTAASFLLAYPLSIACRSMPI